MLVTEKVEYKGRFVDFYEFESIIEDEYGSWENIPVPSEADYTRKKWGMVGQGQRQTVEKNLAEKIKKEYKPRLYLDEPMYIYRLNKYYLESLLYSYGLTLRSGSLTLGMYASALSDAVSKKGCSDEAVDKLMLAFPDIDLDQLIDEKWLCKYQKRFKVLKKVFKLIESDDKLKEFKSTSIYKKRKRNQQLDTIQIMAVRDTYGLDYEDILYKTEIDRIKTLHNK